ncbi:MAG: nuclear transport factor 2 family protein [Colwellia sp.]|nr:nuclear transport factor 2 family protein [Colwellia sp.]
MKLLISLFIGLLMSLTFAAKAENLSSQNFNSEKFANEYFNAWSATQSPTATKQDIEHYLSFLTDDVGHQHYPYDSDDTRAEDGKSSMREGMNYYLGAHTKYSSELVSYSFDFNVVVIKYKSSSTGVHPQTKQEMTINDTTLEVLELEDGKVSLVRKYSD